MKKSAALRTFPRNPNGKKRIKQLEIRKDNLSNCLNTHPLDYLVLDTPKSTNTQSKSMKNTLTTKTMETSQQLFQTNSQTLTSWLEDFLAKLSLLLEKGEDLTTQEEHYFLTSQGFLPTKDPKIYCLKMLKVYYLTMGAELSRQSLGFSPTWGISLSGRFLTAKTSVSTE